MEDENIFEFSETEVIENPDGSVDVDFFTDDLEEAEQEILTEFDDNLVYYLNEDELTEIACMVLDGAEEDEMSREGHIKDLVRGIENLGLNDENVSVPFQGACTVFHPLIMENAVKIQAKAEGELLPAKGPVRTQILGQETDENQDVARRLQRHMNWQLLEDMTEYYPNTQKALLQAALLGDAFKKNYFDPVRGRTVDTLVPIDRLVVNSSVESLECAERLTEIQHISERDMNARIYAGQYADDAEVGSPYQLQKTPLGEKIDRLLGLEGCGEGYEVLQQHVFLDLPGFEDPSGVSLPYIVEVEKVSKEVLSIRRNWMPTGNKLVKREWYTQYGFVPGFGFYNLGYVSLLGNFQDTLTAIMRSLVDAGSFANMQGGFKSKALRVLDDGSAVAPGEFRDVEFYGQDLSKAIYPFQFKEPSPTLMNLLTFIDGKGQKYADSAEQVVADAANYGPVGTTMALLDASTKFFATIYKRFHASQKRQFKIISELNWENLPEYGSAITLNLPGEALMITRDDYDQKVAIIPVSDPNIPTSQHRLTMASQKLQAAQTAPQLHDMREVYKQYYIALGDENYEKYLPAPEEATKREPMEDIVAAVSGKPIKAFPDQDHAAHISIKTAYINDPSIVQNQLFGQVIPVIQANIREHVTMNFEAQMQGASALGLNAQQASQAITEFNQFKAQNPLGTLDPKQLLAQAEMFKQENEAKRLKLVEKKDEMTAAIDTAELEAEIRKQNLNMVQFGLKLQKDEEMQRFVEAVNIAKQALTTVDTSKEV